MTDKNTVFTVEGAKTFADTYCKSCDRKTEKIDGMLCCVGETAEHCKAFREKRNIRYQIALAKSCFEDLFKILENYFAQP